MMDTIQNCESYDIPSPQTYRSLCETLVEIFKSELADAQTYREQADHTRISLVLIFENKSVQ
jgi:hypothetical protein